MKKAIIIGANLGGLTAAILLGRAGWTVSMFEQKDRASLLTGGAENLDLAVFERLELELPPADSYRKKKSWAFLPPNEAETVVAYGQEDSRDVLIDRKKLTEHLLSLAERTAELQFEQPVLELVVDSGHVSGVKTAEGFVSADLTVDCTGAANALRQQLPKFYGISPAPDPADTFVVSRRYYEWGDGAPMPRQTNKLYLRRGGENTVAWCVSDVSDYCADVLVTKQGALEEEEVLSTVEALRPGNPIIGAAEVKPATSAVLPTHRTMTKMVLPGYVILGSTPSMSIPFLTPPLTDTMDAARILSEVLAANDSCKTEDLYVYQVRYSRAYVAREVAMDHFRSWLLSADPEDLNFLFESEVIDGDFLSDLLQGTIPSITTKGRGFFGMGVKKPAVVNTLRTVLADMKEAYDLVMAIPDNYNKTTYMKWQADVESLYRS